MSNADASKKWTQSENVPSRNAINIIGAAYLITPDVSPIINLGEACNVKFWTW